MLLFLVIIVTQNHYSMKLIIFFALFLFSFDQLSSQTCQSKQHQHRPLNEKKAIADFNYQKFINELSAYLSNKGYDYKKDDCLRNFFTVKQSNLLSEIFNASIEENISSDIYSAIYRKHLLEFKQYLKLFIESEQQLRNGYEKIKQSELTANNHKQGQPNVNPLAPCINQDFEAGTLSGWTTTFQNGGGFFSGPNSAFATTPGPDGVVPAINKVFAGNFSACIDVLGSGTDLDWREISQTFLVTNTNKNFVFYVAVIIDGGSHTCATNPFFNVAVTNSVGAVVPCSQVSLIGSGTGGVSCSTFSGWNTSGVYDFLRWTPVIVPLGNYVGQNVTIKYRVTRCNGGGGHGARAYLESSCNPVALQATGNLICPGKSVTVSAPNVSGYSYGWNGPSGGAGNSFSINPTMAGAYTVTMSLTSNPACKMVLDTTIISIPPPISSFNFTVPPCATTFSVPFQSTSTSFSTDPINTQTWLWGDGSGNSVGTSPIHTYPTSGIKNVTLNLVSTAGCTATSTQSLQLNIAPTTGFIKSNACENSIVNFTNTSVPIANILTQTWNFGDGGIDNQYNTSHTYTASGVYTVTLSTTSTDFCVTQSIQTLTVYPKPVMAATANTVCLNLTTAFTNSSTVTPPSVITNYAWDFDNNGTTDNQAYAPTHGFTTIGTTNVELKGTTNFGCKDSILVPVVVNASQTANFTTSNACINSVIGINNTTAVAPPDFITDYDWYYGANATPSVSTGYNPIAPVYSTSGIKTVTLNITSNTTCTASLIQSVEVYARPVANFTASAVCQATATEFTDLSTSQVTINHWQWDWENDGTMDAIGFNSTPSNVYPVSGTYTAALVVTDINFCRDTTIYAFNVWGHPVANFSVVPNCFNAVTNFTNTTVNNVNPNSGFMLNYDWEFGDTDTLNAIINPAHTYTTGMNGAMFSVTLTATNSHFCTDKIAQTVTINPIPVPAMHLNNACLRAEVGIANTSSIVSTNAINSITWDFGPGATPANSNLAVPPSLIYNTVGIKIATLTLTSNQTCTASITDTLEIYSQPVANFTTTSVCQNSATVFSDISMTEGATVVNWQWDFTNNGSIDVTGTTDTTFFVYPASGTYTTSLIILDDRSCSDTVALPLNVYGNAIPNFTASSVCFNDITSYTNLTDVTLNPLVDGILSYNWNFGDGITDPATNPVHTYTSSTNGAIFNATLTATTNHSCVSVASNTVMVNPLPVASFITTNACINSTVGINNTSTVLAPALLTAGSYTWTFGIGSTASNTNASTPIVSYNTIGTKSITLNIMSNQSCTATITNTVEIYGQPSANYSVTAVCQSTASVFTDLSTATGSIALAQWDFDNNSIIDATGSLVSNTFSASGNFASSLIATDNNGCKDTIQVPFIVFGHSAPNFISDTACFNTATSFSNATSTTVNLNTDLIQSYSWDFNDGSTANTLTSPAHTFTNAILHDGGTYSVTLTSVTEHGCVDSITKFININAAPNPSITTTNACINFGIGVNSNASNVAPPAILTGFTWNFGSGASISTSTLANPTGIAFNSSGIKTISLTAITNQNCSALQTQTVEVFAQPVANFSVNAVCQGLNTIFTNLSTTAANSFTLVQWDYTDDSFIDVTGNNASTIVPSSGTYTATLYVVDSNSCKDTVKLPYQVYGHTVPDFTPTNVCFGTATAFNNLTSATTNSNTGGIQSYGWNFGDGTTINTNVTPLHVYTLGGNPVVNGFAPYSVTLTATSGPGCKDSIVKTVNVYSTPTATFTSNDACFGTPTNFVDGSLPNGNAITTFKWDYYADGSTDVTGIQNPNYTFNTYGFIPVTLSVTTSPTIGLVCPSSITKNILVNPLPITDFAFTNKCINAQPNTFNANTTSIALGNVANNIWYFGDGNPTVSSGTLTSVTHSYTSAGTYNVLLTAYSDKGCFKDTLKQVKVYPKPQLLAINASTTCAGFTTSLTAIYATNGASVTSYVWDFDPTLNVPNPTYVFPNGGGTYTINLTSTTNNGCTDVFPKEVEVYYNPIAEFMSAQTSCGPTFCPTFTNLAVMTNTTASEQIVEWTWDFGDGSIYSTASQSNEQHCFTNNVPNVPAFYNVTLTTKTNKGCFNSISKANYISILPSPTANFDVEPNPGNVLTPLMYFTNKSSDYTNFSWNFGDAAFKDSVNVNPTHFYGDYNVTTYTVELIVKNSFGCKDTIYKPVDIGPEFAFYVPNAFSPNESDGINDKFFGKGVGIAQYDMWIFDRWGEMIHHANTLNYDSAWDGRKKGRGTPKQEVYVWKAVVIDIFGKKHEYVGHVTIL